MGFVWLYSWVPQSLEHTFALTRSVIYIFGTILKKPHPSILLRCDWKQENASNAKILSREEISAAIYAQSLAYLYREPCSYHFIYKFQKQPL
jgi:hypothetical protein